MKKALFLFIAFIFVGLGPAYSAEIKNEDCLACHSDLDPKKFESSIHGNNLCTSCHSSIREIPHEEKLPKVDCGNCHRQETQIYNSSDHGQATRHGAPAATCLECHGDVHFLTDTRDKSSPVNRMNIAATCAKCHEDEKKMEPFHLLEAMPVKSYLMTVHGKAMAKKGEVGSATCTDCHGSHDLHAPTNPKSKIFKTNVPATCGKCHENVLKTYQRSIHGKSALSGKRDAPVCTDCHGEHDVLSRMDPASRTYSTSVSIKVCGQCHSAEKITTKYGLPPDSVKTYLESYHGLASKYGVKTVANCASCHGAHDILPSNDPDSSVYKGNLQQTCGRCHPNVGKQLAMGTIHTAPSIRRDRAVYFVTVFYMLLIAGVIGGMLIHNLLDFFCKMRRHYHQKKALAVHPRFTRNERIQHSLLSVTFILLAYTGFSLRYSEAWWALPFTVVGGNIDWRGVVHRSTALIFCLLCVYHLIYILFTKRGVEQVKAMLPVKKDIFDLFGMLRHNLGLSKDKPKKARYNYAEKAEYWALIWGALIMILTGSVLTFENLAMRFMPKWLIDVAATIHFYEAVLATAAIVVWHFYFTIFDPDYYPMNWSMTTGKTEEEHEPDAKHPDQSKKTDKPDEKR